MKLRLTVLNVLSLTALALTMTACGNANQAADGDATRQVKVVGYTANVPFVYLDEDGELTGYEPAVLRAIDELLTQYEFSYEGMDFAAMPVALEAGNAQIAVCMLVKSEERLERFIFPEEPSTLSPMNFLIKEGRDDIQVFDDIGGKIVATGNSGYEYVHMVKWNEKHPGNEIQFWLTNETNSADVYPKILAGEIDAQLLYPQGFQYIEEDQGWSGLALSPVVFVEDTYFMLGKDETELRDAIDGALKTLKADGTLGKISEEWLGEDVFEVYKDIFAAQGDWQEK
ncbi:MAG: transporter substrate-binding domain-containing protein [Clostridium sp.]|nr:transporter substrate-binding domain-containing protein [Clostridium sp.]